jgi:tRNA A37 threonylcarbamoyladenosine dehydratase
MALKTQRSEMLFGDNFAKLQNAKILLLGVGGVGSVCLDCLVRTGITNITIVDCDTYDETNQNRQMWSELHLGESKVEALKQHYPTVKALHVKVDKEWIDSVDFDEYDLILDAIDDIHAKLYLAQKTYKKLISAVGSAKRLDPTKIEVATIWKTHGDRFGAKIRYELKKRKFDKNYTVIFSSEPALIKEKGSFMGVTGAFGFAMCSQAVLKLTGKK